MNADRLIKLGIDLRNRWSGNVKTTCPKCANSRKKSKDPSLSVNIDEGVWNCHHCQWSGSVNQYVRPEPKPAVSSQNIFDWFSLRGIKKETVEHFGVSQAVEWMPQTQKEHPVICFNYFMDGELINIKFKTREKHFKMVKDARKIPYNIDSVKDKDYVIICEGEEETMVWHQSGLAAISVPNGASKNNNNLDWLDSVYELLENKTIYLATDNDEPGRKLSEDIARRFSASDVRIVEFPVSQKDANDCLKAYGQDFVTRLFDDAKPLPVSEISNAMDYLSTIQSYHKDGYPIGSHVDMAETDAHISWNRGELVVVTGIPGSGKSTWLDYMFIRLAHLKGWKFGVFSPENVAPLKITRMTEQLLGKELKQMNDREIEVGTKVISNSFWFYNVETLEDYSINNLLRIAETLIKRNGIDCLCLDPFNYIEQEAGEESSNEKIGNLLRKLKQFAVKNNVNVTLVAHPRKMDKSNGQYNVPRLYDISGSHHFFNVPDVGIAVHRTFDNGVKDPVEVHIQKIKWHFRGKLGKVEYDFNRATGQYSEDGKFYNLLNNASNKHTEVDMFPAEQAWARGQGIQSTSAFETEIQTGIF
jgi:twinkle protein